jgi:hypothetical protein
MWLKPPDEATLRFDAMRARVKRRTDLAMRMLEMLLASAGADTARAAAASLAQTAYELADAMIAHEDEAWEEAQPEEPKE